MNPFQQQQQQQNPQPPKSSRQRHSHFRQRQQQQASHKVTVEHIPSLATRDTILNFLVQAGIPMPKMKLHSNQGALTQNVSLFFDDISSASLAVSKLNGLQVFGNILRAKLHQQKKEHGLKLRTSSALVLYYIQHILLPKKPSEIGNVQCEFNKDKLTLTIKGPNKDIAGNWIHTQLLGCRQLVITTDVDTEEKINLFRNITLNDSCAYGTIVNNFGVMVYFVIDVKKYTILKKYLTSCLQLDSSRISEGNADIELFRKPKNDFDISSNSDFPKRSRRNRNFK